LSTNVEPEIDPGARIDRIAASACTSPYPVRRSTPVSNPPLDGSSMSSAVFSIAATTCAGVSEGVADSSSAATAAACGAAAEVPKKFGKVSGSTPLSCTKNVVLPPSGAVNFGCWRVIGPSGMPTLSK
jgi:hypothetical protein